MHECRELTLEGTDVVAVGLQEVEMGTASVFSGAVKERINRRGAELGNHNARWWADELHQCLLEHDPQVRMLVGGSEYIFWGFRPGNCLDLFPPASIQWKAIA